MPFYGWMEANSVRIFLQVPVRWCVRNGQNFLVLSAWSIATRWGLTDAESGAVKSIWGKHWGYMALQGQLILGWRPVVHHFGKPSWDRPKLRMPQALRRVIVAGYLQVLSTNIGCSFWVTAEKKVGEDNGGIQLLIIQDFNISTNPSFSSCAVRFYQLTGLIQYKDIKGGGKYCMSSNPKKQTPLLQFCIYYVHLSSTHLPKACMWKINRCKNDFSCTYVATLAVLIWLISNLSLSF